MKTDLLLACFFLVVSGVVAVTSYRAMQAVEVPEQALLRSIALGKHHHLILQGERCVGSFTTEFRLEPETTIVSQGQVRFRYQEKQLTANVFAGVLFNALDQLVTANFAYSTNDVRVEANLSNPNPLHATIKSSFLGNVVEKQLTLPGPVFLRRNSDGSYRIDYSVLNAAFSSYGKGVSQLPALNLDLHIAPGTDAEKERCDALTESPQPSIALDSAVEQLQKLMLTFPGTNFLTGAPQS